MTILYVAEIFFYQMKHCSNYSSGIRKNEKAAHSNTLQKTLGIFLFCVVQYLAKSPNQFE